MAVSRDEVFDHVRIDCLDEQVPAGMRLCPVFFLEGKCSIDAESTSSGKQRPCLLLDGTLFLLVCLGILFRGIKFIGLHI